MLSNVTKQIFDAIYAHLQANEADLRIDDREVHVVPYNPTTTYKPVYPVINMDAVRITSYEPTMDEGGLHDFVVEFLVIDKMNHKQQSEIDVQNRISDISYRMVRTLDKLQLGKPFARNYQFEAFETVANNEASGQVTMNIESVLITDCN